MKSTHPIRCFCLLLVLSLALVGCYVPARYHLEGHKQIARGQGLENGQAATVKLRVGESLRAVTPAKALGPTGYWLSILVRDPDVAKVEPHGESLLHGTRITGVSPGRTRAFYTNAPEVYLADQDSEFRDQYPGPDRRGTWFWIEVTP